MIEESLIRMASALERIADALEKGSAATPAMLPVVPVAPVAPMTQEPAPFEVPVKPEPEAPVEPAAALCTLDMLRDRLIALTPKFGRDRLLSVLKTYDVVGLAGLEKTDYPRVMADLARLEVVGA